jgi:hypothetical protein
MLCDLKRKIPWIFRISIDERPGFKSANRFFDVTLLWLDESQSRESDQEGKKGIAQRGPRLQSGRYLDARVPVLAGETLHLTASGYAQYFRPPPDCISIRRESLLSVARITGYNNEGAPVDIGGECVGTTDKKRDLEFVGKIRTDQIATNCRSSHPCYHDGFDPLGVECKG